MATREQCEKELRKNPPNGDEAGRLQGRCLHHKKHVQRHASRPDDEFVRLVIDALLDSAHDQRHFDQLGMELGLPSDAEDERQGQIWTNRRSWIAVLISAGALVVAIVSLLVSMLRKP